MKHFKVYCWLILGTAILYACSKRDAAVPKTEEIRFSVPTNFPEAVYKFEGNTLTNNGFALGKKLFYDVRLSADQSVSCGSCHQQFAGFAQLDHPVSHGVNNCLGKRNAPVLFNLAWQKEFFWDGGAKNLEVSPLNAISDPCEMGTNLTQIVDFLSRTNPYPQLFKDAFGSSEINSQNFLRALAQFMAPMVSANSKYDKVMRKVVGNSFTADEQKGYELFKEKCASCHTEPLFTNLTYSNNGLDAKSIDEGRKLITGLTEDQGKFRIPTLRNVEVSSPYMHDGRFNTLDKVLDHYSTGVKQSDTLDPLLTAGTTLGIPLNTLQKQQLISFLKTLTDDEFIKNQAFSEY